MAKMRCYLLPIEPLDQRYTAQWLDWFPRALRGEGFDVVTLHPEVDSGTLTAEQFLDPTQTHAYKAAQIEMLVDAVDMRHQGLVVFLDAWHPGVISACYMRDMARLPIRVTGVLHAGCYDPHDRLAQAGMGRWAGGFELSLLRGMDEVLVGSVWHRTLIERAYPGHGGDVHVLPLPVRAPAYDARARRRRIVVWPHRDVPEKQTLTWRVAAERLRRRYPEWRFVETLQETSTKAEYYALLSTAAIAVSAARQETFGIAMVEAAQLGCRVIVPGRLSYPELFTEDCFADVDRPEDMEAAIAGRIEAHEAHRSLPRAMRATSQDVRRGEVGIARRWAKLAGLGGDEPR